MEKYQKVLREKEPMENDEIRVSSVGSIRIYLGDAMKMFEKENLNSICVKATGKAIARAVSTAEIIKRKIKNLYQITKIGTMTIVDVYEPLEEGLEPVSHQRNVSFIEIILSKEQLDDKNVGYQSPLTEEEYNDITSDDIFKSRGIRGSHRGGGGHRGGAFYSRGMYGSTNNTSPPMGTYYRGGHRSSRGSVHTHSNGGVHTHNNGGGVHTHNNGGVHTHSNGDYRGGRDYDIPTRGRGGFRSYRGSRGGGSSNNGGPSNNGPPSQYREDNNNIYNNGYGGSGGYRGDRGGHYRPSRSSYRGSRSRGGYN